MSNSPPNTFSIPPMDSHNQKLVSNVHPPDWVNPEPAQRYNLVVLVRKADDKILGATIVASHAGDMISEITLAMVGGLGLKTLSQVVNPYPTLAEAIKKVADNYSRSVLLQAS